MKKRFYLVILLIILVGGEFVLRHFIGLTQAPLYFESDKYEYMACPNQDGYRFGNHYHYNSYSQRSEEPDTTKRIILGLGDSVIFGGVQTDQDSLATTLFTEETGMQMLNISAGSWGPDNCAAYLKEKGLFHAEAMFLLVSSHDAHDNMTFEPVVGIHPSYPKEHYKLAYWELLDRYVLPRIFKKKRKNLDPDQQVNAGTGVDIKKDGKVFNPGFEQLRMMADSAGIPLIVYLHADAKELQNGQYNEQGKEIMAWAETNQVPLIRELEYKFTPDDYRDGIHLNKDGQKKLSEIMIKTIPQYLK